MAETTTKGYPYPEGPDPVDVAGDIQSLAEAVDAAPGVQSLTGAQISALTVGEKWAGRVVWNSTTSKLQVSNGSTFSDVDSTSPLSSAAPQALGVAAAGTSTDVSRGDHVHAMPSATAVGAIATGALASSNPAALGSAAAGTSTSVARADHVHPTDGLVLNSLVGAINGVASLDSAGQVPASQLGNASGAKASGVIYENAQTISSNYTMTTSYNGLSAGPISIGTGVTVTVPSGSVWAIV